ncbi:hypothetical protein AKJ61_04585, partial [candidate division MSBL1 archaeon SCGC-AAA259B11]
MSKMFYYLFRGNRAKMGKTPIHPKASKVQVTSEALKGLNLPPGVTVEAYDYDGTLKELESWYKDQMPKYGWENRESGSKEEFWASLWKKDEGDGLLLMSGKDSLKGIDTSRKPLLIMKGNWRALHDIVFSPN